MFTINKEDKTIDITRGDIGVITVTAKKPSKEEYMFKVGDVVRFNVCVKGRHESIVLSKEVVADVEQSTMSIQLTSADTRIGKVINKPVEYWYEIVLNPDTASQTLIGYDIKGPKIFRLFPEGDDSNE